MGLHRRHLALLVTSASLSLTACGGGGGGGGDNPDFGNAGAFQTQEFNNSTALAQIKAAEGYARIPGEVGGDGVRVAVIDDGIDADHGDLDDNIFLDLTVDPDQTQTTFGAGPNDDHGTLVAGVIAAERNDEGIHGVAFDSGIVSIDVASFDDDLLVDQFANIEEAILGAAGLEDIDGEDAEADIINMSLGLPESTVAADVDLADALDDVADAMEEAADENKIMVVALGNEALTGPSSPANFVSLDGIAGLGIAVGSIEADNQTDSDFSNLCGDVAEFCLFAPGRQVNTTTPGGDTLAVDGTSFAAPLVAGSAAVVKAAFPGISNRDVVDRLLTTAQDIGAVGTDERFGRGVLDLEAALAPVGELSASVGASLDDPRIVITDSQVSVDSSSALGGDAAKLLADAIVFDEQDFPFAVDLEQHVDRRSRSTGLDSFVGADRALSTVQTTDYGSVSLAFDDDQRIEDPHRAEFEESEVDLKEEKFDPKVRFQSELADGVDFFMSLNGTSATDLGLSQSLAAEEGSFFQQSAFLAPFEKLAGLQSGGGAAYDLDDDTKIAVTAFAAADDEALTKVSMQKVELVHRTVGDLELRAGYGLLQEEGGFLGSATTGAFGAGTSTDSQYVNVSMKAPLSETVSLFGAYTQGRSSTSAGSSLLDNFSDTLSEAFGAGLVVQGLLEDGDGFSLMVGQPLRVTSGSADVTVAVGRTEDGQVLTETAKADLSPDAREITTEAVYDFSLDGENQSLSTGAFARFNPDNDPDASPDIGFGVKYQLRF